MMKRMKMNETDNNNSYDNLCADINRPVNSEHNDQCQGEQTLEAAIGRAVEKLSEQFRELIKAIADLSAEIINSNAFEELCAEIREIYYQRPPAKIPPKAIDPTVDAPVRHIIPRARSQLRCTKRR